MSTIPAELNVGSELPIAPLTLHSWDLSLQGGTPEQRAAQLPHSRDCYFSTTLGEFPCSCRPKTLS